MTTTVLTPEQVAERWQVHPRTVKRRCESGELHGFRVGDLWRIPLRAVEAYETRGSTPAEPVADSATPRKPVSQPATDGEYVAVVKGPVPWRLEIVESRAAR